MTRRRATWCLLATIAAALVLPASTSPARESEELEKWVLQASRQQPYVPSSAEELRGVEDLFVRTLQTPDRLDELVAGWRADHWEILPLGESGDPLWLVREAPGHACGRGCYAFRPQQRPGIVLQAPHSFADKYTRKLALLLFQEGRIRGRRLEHGASQDRGRGPHGASYVCRLYACRRPSPSPGLHRAAAWLRPGETKHPSRPQRRSDPQRRLVLPRTIRAQGHRAVRKPLPLWTDPALSHSDE